MSSWKELKPKVAAAISQKMMKSVDPGAEVATEVVAIPQKMDPGMEAATEVAATITTAEDAIKHCPLSFGSLSPARGT